MQVEPRAALRALPSPPEARRPPGRSAAAVSAEDFGGERVSLTSISWTASDEMRFEQWVRNGRRLGAVGRGVGWWIGDWLRFGNARYGEKYAQAAKITGYDTQTLMNMVYVAGSIDPAQRREKLSWSHHAEVAAMEPDEQRRWLDRAEESRLSVQDLRLLLRKSRRSEPLKVLREKAAAEHALVCPECGHAFASADEDGAEPAAVVANVSAARAPRGRPAHPPVPAKRAG